MPARRLALAALLLAAALPARAAPGRVPVPVLHLSVGTGVCAEARSDAVRVDNPCWLQLGLAPALRLGRVELGLTYEGRDLLKLVTARAVRPPATTALGASAGLVAEPGERWRLLAAGELGWRRYLDFAGSGISSRTGAIEVAYLGLSGRAGFGLRARSGRTNRLEASLSVRRDLETGRATVDGAGWRAGGWSLTMGLGLVSEW
jgi:hypothetical protein